MAIGEIQWFPLRDTTVCVWGGAVKSNGISTSLLTTKQKVGVLLKSFQCFSLMTLGSVWGMATGCLNMRSFS